MHDARRRQVRASDAVPDVACALKCDAASRVSTQQCEGTCTVLNNATLSGAGALAPRKARFFESSPPQILCSIVTMELIPYQRAVSLEG